VKQGAFIKTGAIKVFQYDVLIEFKFRDTRCAQLLDIRDLGACLVPPYICKMALATPCRTLNQVDMTGPCRPGVDEIDSSRITRTYKKIVCTQCRAMREIQNQLFTHRHTQIRMTLAGRAYFFLRPALA
jgi:hypothetical protein